MFIVFILQYLGIKCLLSFLFFYYFTGYMLHDGKVIVELCGIAERWDNLSMAQKKNLKYRYQKGCECKVCNLMVVVDI